MDWHEYFFKMVRLVASKSKDRSSKVGCVVVDPDNRVRATGYNGFPVGVDDDVDQRHQRPQKYLWTEHAERNACYSAARAGISLSGCRMYTEWHPCADCARAIIQSGIKRVLVDKTDYDEKKRHWDERWKDNVDIATEMLNEAGVSTMVI